MSRIQFTIACVGTDRSRPVLDGRVALPGVDLVPVGETEFARDASFAYAASDLREVAAR